MARIVGRTMLGLVFAFAFLGVVGRAHADDAVPYEKFLGSTFVSELDGKPA